MEGVSKLVLTKASNFGLYSGVTVSTNFGISTPAANQKRVNKKKIQLFSLKI